MRIEEPKKPIQKAVVKPAPTPQPAPQNNDLTLQNNNANIQLDVHSEEANIRIASLRMQGELRVSNPSKNHKKHAKDLVDAQNKTEEQVWEDYQAMASEFMKLEIDGEEIDGFVDDKGKLYKYSYKTKMYGVCNRDGRIGTFFKPTKDECGVEPDDYWEAKKKAFRRKR